jgi:hypothetical protein
VKPLNIEMRKELTPEGASEFLKSDSNHSLKTDDESVVFPTPKGVSYSFSDASPTPVKTPIRLVTYGDLRRIVKENKTYAELYSEQEKK